MIYVEGGSIIRGGAGMRMQHARSIIVQHLQLLDIYELPTTYFLLTSLGLAS
jgi:hypothetical protein